MRVTRLEELAERIARGEYAVDPHAVAAAMLVRSPMFVPAQPVDRPAVGVEHDQPAPGADLA
jgi:Anti-sigma-28 factor, FlgM